MPLGLRHLTVLKEFKPFGLITEALDGDNLDNAGKYDYFIFDNEVVTGRHANSDCLGSNEHEIFVQGNRVTWSAGSRVMKRFTLPSSVDMVCWCRLGDLPEAFLCILQRDAVTLYNTSGELTSIPISCAIKSSWSLPFGLLLQQENAMKLPTHIPISSPGSLSSSRDARRMKKESRFSPRRDINCGMAAPGRVTPTDRPSMSSHLLLKDPMEEPQPLFVRENGMLTIMKEYDERTVWTSDVIPLMVSYNKEKFSHSIWVIEAVNSEVSVSDHDAIPPGVLPKPYSFRRIWQESCPTAANKVFLATADSSTSAVCFLLQKEERLLAVGLSCSEVNNEALINSKPDMNWALSAVAAAPVVVTHPRVRVGLLRFTDILVLAPDRTLLLYSGRQCLCRYALPLSREHPIYHGLKSSGAVPLSSDMEIVGLSDAISDRFNLTMNNGQMFRCALRKLPSSTLTSDCLMAMFEGLSSKSYNDFLTLFWGVDDSKVSPGVDRNLETEWASFSRVLLHMCRKSEVVPVTDAGSAWEFLLNSSFHKNYNHHTMTPSIIGLNSSFRDEDYNDIQKPDDSKKLLEILDCLHSVYECLKLESLRRRDLALLVELLCNISVFLHEKNYLDFYIRDFPRLSLKFRITGTSFSLRNPPSLFKWLHNCMSYGCHSANVNEIPLLVKKGGGYATLMAQKTVSCYSILFGEKINLGASGGAGVETCPSPEELAVLSMSGDGFGLQQLDTLPSGVSLPLRHAIYKCRESPPVGWTADAYTLLGREDLSLSSSHSGRYKDSPLEASRNPHSGSTPYMLHLRPVIVPSTVSDSMGIDSDTADTDHGSASLVDGMEHIFNSTVQSRYWQDMRLNEVRHILCSSKLVAIRTTPNHGSSEQELQQGHLWKLAQRTTALPIGRGAFTLATVSTLMTEAFTVPELVLAGRLPSQQNATVNLDPNLRNTEELKSWPEFHNAVAAGLRFAPHQGKLSRTWIIYNKPKQPNVTHAGLLLALGLHCHLDVLTMADIYQYFSQEHESTTVGLMLGLAASYRGTMQPSISKSLHFHIPSQRLSYVEQLELPTLMQSAALLSLGILFEASTQPQIMQTLLGEIGRRSAGDNVLEREGYAVSAGFALGLVGMGRGQDAVGLMDGLVNQLLHYVGVKGLESITDSNPINVHVTSPGATIALGLLFFKTESSMILSRLSIPSKRFDMQYVRPDFVMLRVISRNLIMWSRIQPSKEWVKLQVPQIIYDGVQIHFEEVDDTDEIDAETFVQMYANIVVGACISIGLRFAGSRDENAQELLHDYALFFLNEIKPISYAGGISFPVRLSRYVDRNTLSTCLHLIVLCLSVVMAGSGHLKTFRLLRFLRNRTLVDGSSIYGTQMAVNLAIGFLFLGGGMRTFSTTNSSVAVLLLTMYPRLPNGPNDNRCHLQAFRHLYVLATEPRCIQTIDVDTELPVCAPVEIKIVETQQYSKTCFLDVTPCLLPERAIFKSIRICGPQYWPQTIELNPEDKGWWSYDDKSNPFNSGILYVKRKAGSSSHGYDPKGCHSLLSHAMHKVSGLNIGEENEQGSSVTVEELVSTFSTDPSLISLARFCSDPSLNNRIGDEKFSKFCSQVLFECVSKDRSPLLQVYLSLYTNVESMEEQVANSTVLLEDSLFIHSLKLAVAYNEAVLAGRVGGGEGGVIQSGFVGHLKRRTERLLEESPELKGDFVSYVKYERWPDDRKRSIILSCYLQWFDVPPPPALRAALHRLAPPRPSRLDSPYSPLFPLLFPTTHPRALRLIHHHLSLPPPP